MFLEIEKANFSQDFCNYAAKELNISIKEFLHYSNIFDTDEKGIYGSFLEDNFNPSKFKVIDKNNTRLDVKLPKSIIKRKKRKLSKVGYIKSSTILEIKNYGLADDEHQIKKEYSFLDKSKNKYVILVTPIYRENEPSRGGFRYHKHGRYIGNKDLKNEYLYDDKHIDRIIKFIILEIEEVKFKDFGNYKYQLFDQYILNKNQDIVALFYYFSRQICVGYIGTEKSFDIPKNIDLDDKEQLLKFINSLEL